MSKKYIDEFIKLPVTKMAQKISDMTYLHENTEVPKNHYQKLLQQEMLEMMAQDSTMQLVLLNAILGQMQALQKESPTLFLKALICMEKGIKVENINNRVYDSLENTCSQYENGSNLLNQDILQVYNHCFDTHNNDDGGISYLS